MRIALYDGPEALTTIDMPPAATQSPAPWEVRVSIIPVTAEFDPARNYGAEKIAILKFHATRISMLNPDKSVGHAWLAVPADLETAAIIRPALAGAAAIPGVPPQHVPAFIERLRRLLKAAG